MFRTVSRFRTGYDPDQVDTFFTHARRVYEGDAAEPLNGADVRRAAFDLVRGGYATSSVDGALDRLERAFMTRERQNVLGAQGQQAWMEHMADRARSLYERLRRPEGRARAAEGREIAKLTGLKTLHLWDTLITDDGLAALAPLDQRLLPILDEKVGPISQPLQTSACGVFRR